MKTILYILLVLGTLTSSAQYEKSYFSMSEISESLLDENHVWLMVLDTKKDSISFNIEGNEIYFRNNFNKTDSSNYKLYKKYMKVELDNDHFSNDKPLESETIRYGVDWIRYSSVDSSSLSVTGYCKKYKGDLIVGKYTIEKHFLKSELKGVLFQKKYYDNQYLKVSDKKESKVSDKKELFFTEKKVRKKKRSRTGIVVGAVVVVTVGVVVGVGINSLKNLNFNIF